MSHSPHLFAHIQASYGMHPPGIDAPAEIPTAVIQEILAERQARDEALRELNDEYEARVAAGWHAQVE